MASSAGGTNATTGPSASAACVSVARRSTAARYVRARPPTPTDSTTASWTRTASRASDEPSAAMTGVGGQTGQLVDRGRERLPRRTVTGGGDECPGRTRELGADRGHHDLTVDADRHAAAQVRCGQLLGERVERGERDAHGAPPGPGEGSTEGDGGGRRRSDDGDRRQAITLLRGRDDVHQRIERRSADWGPPGLDSHGDERTQGL